MGSLEGAGVLARAARREVVGEPMSLVPLTGSRNNRVFRGHLASMDVCVKVYAVDGRGRDRREWAALRLLSEAGWEAAPAPLHHEAEPAPPVVIMGWVTGEPLGNRPLDDGSATALAGTLELLYRLRPPSQVPEISTPPLAMLARVRDGLVRSTWPEEVAAAAVRARGWVDGLAGSALVGPADRWGRGDPSLGNCLWDGQRGALVDFEYAGRVDPVYELADLVEHPQSRATGDDVWPGVLERFDLGAGERRRLAQARRLLAAYWLCRLAGMEGSDVTARRADQARRVAVLLDTAI